MNLLTKLMSPDTGVSSKRAITIFAFFLLAIGFLSNLFFGLTVEEFMYNTISYVVFAGLGFTASEMFAKKPDDKSKTEDSPE